MVVYLHDTFDYSLVLAEEKYRQTRRLKRGEKKRAPRKKYSLLFHTNDETKLLERDKQFLNKIFARASR